MFCYKEAQFKKICLSMKTNYLPAKNFNETLEIDSKEENIIHFG